MKLIPSMVLTLLLVAATGLRADEATGTAADKDALFENTKVFVEAFHAADAKKLAGLWTTDGDYTDLKGHHLKGRAKIEAAFKEVFAESKGLKLRIDSEALKFVTPTVAVEDGTTEVIHADGSPPNKARYTIVHVKKGGKWAISSVREAEYTPPTNYSHLKDLEWAIGEWADEAGKGDVARLAFVWARNQNFIVSTFHTSFKSITLGGGTQWIGYDAAAKAIRSWTFDHSGAFAEGSWSRDGKTWTVKVVTTLRDGQKATATNVISVVDADTFTWESKDRTLDGKSLPDIKPVRLKRQK